MGAIPPDVLALSREQLADRMANAPPAASLISEEDRAFAVANVDLLRDDYAEILVDMAAATGVGSRRRLVHFTIGAVVGVGVGALVAYFVGGR